MQPPSRLTGEFRAESAWFLNRIRQLADQSNSGQMNGSKGVFACAVHEWGQIVEIGDRWPQCGRVSSTLQPHYPNNITLLPETVRSGGGPTTPSPPPMGSKLGRTTPGTLGPLSGPVAQSDNQPFPDQLSAAAMMVAPIIGPGVPSGPTVCSRTAHPSPCFDISVSGSSNRVFSPCHMPAV